MLRRLLPWTLAAAAAAAILAGVWPSGGGQQQTVQASLRPRTVLFGDPVLAQLDVSRGATVSASFAPYRVVSMRRSGGSLVYRLACLTADCLPLATERQIDFPPATVTVADRTLTVRWPSLQVASRLRPADVAEPRFRPGGPVAARFRLDPTLLGWGMTGAAAALVLGLGAWGGSRLRPPRPRLELVPPVAQSELDEALAAVETALDGSPSERRTSLDRLALALAGEPLHTRTRTLAWAEPTPEPAAMRQLLALVRAGEA